MKLPIAMALAAALISFAASAEPVTYVNERFGTTVTFPGEVFTEMMPPPENNDGRTWLAADGGSIAVYGSNNALEQTPAGIEDEAKARSEAGYELTYSRTGKDWVVLSGLESDKVFYHRLEFGSEDVIHAVLIKYPQALKAAYDPLVGPIAGSLTGP